MVHSRYYMGKGDSLGSRAMRKQFCEAVARLPEGPSSQSYAQVSEL
jgi:hypothetical protein